VHAVGFAPKEQELPVAYSTSNEVVLPRIELSEEAIVEGVVRDARGDPVAGARVARDRVPTYLAVGTAPRGVAVTDARGRFRLGELPAGTVMLEAYAPDFGRSTAEEVRLTAGRTTSGVELRLQKDVESRAQEPAAAGGVAVTLAESGDPHEVVVVNVAQGSEAERAGLATGDVLVQIDGAAVHTMSDARARLAGPLGDDVVIQYRRGETTDSVRVAREPVRK
jgi:membrane-associated protease RseP (regulator of RpoE activity)